MLLFIFSFVRTIESVTDESKDIIAAVRINFGVKQLLAFFLSFFGRNFMSVQVDCGDSHVPD